MVAIKGCRPTWATMAAALCLGSQLVGAVKLDLSSKDSIEDTASSIAKGMMASYDGDEEGKVPGNLPEPYSWWECGAMFGAIIDYWHYTNDSIYNDIVQEGLLHQVGYADRTPFLPDNQTRSLGNSDQAIWGLAALTAAETSFLAPPKKELQWLELAQGVFDSMASVWDKEVDDKTCGGGLRWQVFSFNNGYNYKDNISNGGFFNLAARLARFTGNGTYADYAGKVWDWTNKIGLIDDFRVYDGVTVEKGKCSDLSKVQWSISHGLYLSGAASLYNSTNGSNKWKDRVDGLLNTTQLFFNDTVLTEVACEKTDVCDTDMRPFKSYLAREMATTVQLAPHTKENIMKKLRDSAEAVSKACVDSGEGKIVCPHSWDKTPENKPKNDVGNQLSALQVVQANLIDQASPPPAGKGRSDGPSGTDSSGTGSPTSSASGSATSTGAASPLNVQQILSVSPVISLVFGYFL